MYEHETFRNAPITEALIDIRTVPGAAQPLDLVNAFAAEVADQFPNRKPRMEHKHEVKLEAEIGVSETHTESQKVGLVLFSDDRTKAVQARVNGFSFSKMKPYGSWEELQSEAMALWPSYVEHVKPERVTRLAVRYINRIPIPLPIGDFQEYVLTYPQLANGIPQGLSEFFMRLVVPKPNTEFLAVISSTMERPDEDQKVLPYIFDIDVFVAQDHSPEDRDIWNVFGQLRDYKNEIFFSSMTERAKELFR